MRGAKVSPPYSRCFTDAPWHPFRIVLIVLGFMVWWPIGLVTLKAANTGEQIGKPIHKKLLADCRDRTIKPSPGIRAAESVGQVADF